MSKDLDINFYKKAYPDLRFLSDLELEEHYYTHGINENRIGSKKELSKFIDNLPYSFDLTTYQSYPDVPLSMLDAKVHYYMHGHPEGRIYNYKQLEVCNAEQEHIIKTELNNIPDPPTNSNDKKFNILIRTHARGEKFSNCIKSVFLQDYKNYHIYVCGQSVDDLVYINQQISNYENVSIILGKRTSNEGYFFNDFMNQLLSIVSTGWVITLDDDDMFTSPSALSEISKHITLDNMVIWKYKRPDKIIYPDVNKPLTNPGTITSTSYCIHISVAKTSKWPSKRQGDFEYIAPIYSNIDRQLLDYTLTKYQLDNKTASFGEPDDNVCLFPEECQLYTSPSLSHLHQRFAEKYNLTNYISTNLPCIFFGFYVPGDFEAFHKHRGPRLVMFGGSDCDLRIDGARRNILELASTSRSGDSFLHISTDIQTQLNSLNVTSKKFDLNLVDTELFYPRKRPGDHVFIYNGMNGLGNEKIYGKRYYDVIAETLPEYKYIYSNELHQPYEQMPDIYSQCFIGLRLTDQDGNANMVQEFEAMGLPVVHNSSEYGLKWDSAECIVNHILTHSPQS